ncbi:MAG: hypothetical protein GF331_10700 [Chitinivibrionales bacterium]|nr:hypothetical protein [Chitinivibrionales bacterium]
MPDGVRRVFLGLPAVVALLAGGVFAQTETSLAGIQPTPVDGATLSANFKAEPDVRKRVDFVAKRAQGRSTCFSGRGRLQKSTNNRAKGRKENHYHLAAACCDEGNSDGVDLIQSTDLLVGRLNAQKE